MATSTAPGGLPVIRAAGGVVQKSTPQGEEIMVVYRKRHQDWTLPKGKLKDGESFQDAALREVHEETGCFCHLGSYLGTISYAYKGVPKVVMFWRMSVVEERLPVDSEEIAEAVWMPISAAMQRLTHAQEKSLLARLAGSAKLTPLHQPKAEDQSQSQSQVEDAPALAPPVSTTPPAPASGEPAPPQLPVSQAGTADDAELRRDVEAFKIELAYLERRRTQQEEPWAIAAREHLGLVDCALAGKDWESVRSGLLRARRYTVLGLNQEELATRAQVLRDEAATNSSWRAAAIRRLLALSDDKLSAVRVAEAMGLRDEDAPDEKEPGRRILHPVQGLVLMCLLGAALTVSLLVAGLLRENALALLVAMMGAAISAAPALWRRKRDSGPPNLFFMLLTVALSSVAGLAAAPLCAYLAATFNPGRQPAWLSIAMAFVLGYATQRFLVRFAVESRDPTAR